MTLRLSFSAAVVLVAASLGFVAGCRVSAWQLEAAASEDRAERDRELRRMRDRAAEAAAQHEATRARLHARHAELLRRIDRELESNPSLRRECLDADGLRILGDAIDGRSGESDATVRTADDAR